VEGDAAKLPPAPKFTEGWAMGTPDVELKMPEAYEVPAEGRDNYRNFVLPLNFDEDNGSAPSSCARARPPWCITSWSSSIPTARR
jgi:hypothetical protein